MGMSQFCLLWLVPALKVGNRGVKNAIFFSENCNFLKIKAKYQPLAKTQLKYHYFLISLPNLKRFGKKIQKIWPIKEYKGKGVFKSVAHPAVFHVKIEAQLHTFNCHVSFCHYFIMSSCQFRLFSCFMYVSFMFQVCFFHASIMFHPLMYSHTFSS